MKKFLLSLFTIFCVLATANAETYTHTFSKGELTTDGGTVTLSDIAWSATKATAIDWNTTKGIQLGNKSTACESYTLSTSGFTGCTIRSITVNSSIAASGDATVAITIGSQTSESYKLTTSDAAYTFDCDDTTGDITISWAASQRAYYVKSITIEYSLPADMVEVVLPVFKTQPGIYADKIRVIAETTEQDAVLYYTLDGTVPSYEDFNSDPRVGTTKCSKAWQLDETLTSSTTINTIKVMSVKTDGDAVYKSEIAEATYIVSPTTPYIPAKEIESGCAYTMVAADSAACGLYGEVTSPFLPTKTSTTVNDRYIETVACAGFTFTAVDGGYTIMDEFGRFVCPGENGFTFTTEEPVAWNVATDSEGNATITSGNSTILYSTNDSVFGCYSEKNAALLLPKLYKQRAYPTYTVTPEAGSSMDALESILVTCSEGITTSDLTVVCESDSISATFTVMQKDENTLEFKLPEILTSRNNANISINLTGDILLNPNGINMKLPLTEKYGVRTLVNYTINGYAPAATITEISPANGSTVEELSHFIFTSSYYAIHSEDAALQPRLYAEGKEWTYALEKTTDNEKGEHIKMSQAALKTAEPLRGNGTYILEIPTGYFTDGNGKEIEGMTLKYYVKNDSGLVADIEDITIESNNGWTVYSIAGTKVLETTNAHEMQMLPKGIYIVNGTKVVIE